MATRAKKSGVGFHIMWIIQNRTKKGRRSRGQRAKCKLTTQCTWIRVRRSTKARHQRLIAQIEITREHSAHCTQWSMVDGRALSKILLYAMMSHSMHSNDEKFRLKIEASSTSSAHSRHCSFEQCALRRTSFNLEITFLFFSCPKTKTTTTSDQKMCNKYITK